MEQILINLLRKFAKHIENGEFEKVVVTNELLENCANLIEFQFNHIAELKKVIVKIEKQLDSINEP